MPLCPKLTAGFSHWKAPTVSVWGLLLPWLMVDSRLCKLSLQLLFATLSWSTTMMLSFLELAEEDCFWHAYVFHPSNVASLAQLHLKQDGLNAGQAGCLEDFFIWHTVLPFDAKDGNASSIVETTQVAWVLCHNLACACQGNTAVNIASLIKSMMSWRHLACWQLCTSGDSFFCSLLVKSKPTWLRNGKLKS